jgi:hypothetical protein
MIEEAKTKKKMQQNVDIKRPGKREESKNQGKRVEDT